MTQIYIDTRDARIAKANVNKNKAGGFKTYYRPAEIKTAWNWHKSQREYQQNRIEIPETNPRNYSQLIFNKPITNPVSTKVAGENLICACSKKHNSCLTPSTKMNSKWIQDVNL